ncbi:hypothetical protein B0H13DRAFT_1876989 [Mycena leptocephala]|nr:hypothetical protein B0H13DRAFT_1876989 [Mycena leptocephala]
MATMALYSTVKNCQVSGRFPDETGNKRAETKREIGWKELERRGDKAGNSRCDVLDSKREKTGINGDRTHEAINRMSNTSMHGWVNEWGSGLGWRAGYGLPIVSYSVQRTMEKERE